MRPIVRQLLRETRNKIPIVLKNAAEVSRVFSRAYDLVLGGTNESKITYLMGSRWNHSQPPKTKAWRCELEISLLRHNPTVLRVMQLGPDFRTHRTIFKAVLIDFMDNLHLEDSGDLEEAKRIALQRLNKCLGISSH